MASYQIEVGARIKITPAPPFDIRQNIKEALTIRVPATPDRDEYVKCLAELEVKPSSGYRREMAEFKSMTVPRGFLSALKAGFNHHGVKYEVKYNTIYEHDTHMDGKHIRLRPYQEDAVTEIATRLTGVILAPPAAGKTVLTLEAIRRLGQKSLIIVDKLNLVDQWCERSKEFLGIQPDIITEGKVTVASSGGSMITVAMQQSLRLFISDDDWFHRFGFVCLDECHHVSADTYLEVFQRFPAEYRIGLSATPYRSDGLDLISKMVIGPVIYTITSEELEANRRLMRPKIVRVQSGFKHDFWSTHYTPKDRICEKPLCSKNGTAHSHKNNYQTVTKALVEDNYRDTVIATEVNRNRDNCNLIVSDRLAHLANIRSVLIKLGFPEERTHMFTGEENAKERAEVVRLAGYGSCAIFSTIAKEALDIPRLDRLYLAWPIRKEHILQQQIGRITRTHPDKADAVVYDYVDGGCTVLANQSWERFNYYRQKNYQIEEK